jgi:protein-S-isoprenylcysteine O-methyltransferase Ste14
VSRLALRVARISVLFSLLMCVAIFLPAGSFDYWQAWVLIVVYGTCGTLLGVYFWKKDRALVERRLKSGPWAEASPAQRLIVSLFLVGYVGAFVFSSLDHRLHWSTYVPLLAPIGNIIVVFGCYMYFLAMRENSFAGGTIEVTPDQRVVSSGPYAVVRHPLYVGLLLLLTGIPLALGSYWGLAISAAMIPLVAWRLLDEEAFLVKHLTGYAAYQQRVRWRLIPGLF